MLYTPTVAINMLSMLLYKMLSEEHNSLRYHHNIHPFCFIPEAFWKYREDSPGVVPEVLAKHGYSTFPSVKEEQPANNSCSSTTISAATRGERKQIVFRQKH